MTQTEFMFALTGAVIAFLAFWYPEKRRRAHEEQVSARLAARLTADVLALVVERLQIRCDRARYGQDRKTLRGFRATAAIETLGAVNIEKLPNVAIEHFVRFRAGVFALNSAMDQEAPAEPVPTGDYAVVYKWTLQSFRSLQRSLQPFTTETAPEPEWQCPENPPSFVWGAARAETI